MKKLLLCATLVSVAFTSCVTNEELVPEQQSKEISFEVASYVPQTRTSGVFETGQTFAASAWYTLDSALDDEDLDGTPEIETDQMMDGVSVSYDGAKWTTSSPYYWPKKGTVDFICYYPKGVAPTTITYDYNGNDNLQYNYTVKNSNSTTTPVYTASTTATDDLMYANKAIRFNGNQTATDNDSDLGFDGDYGFDGVPTLFNHALAKLNFKVKNAKPDDGTYKWIVTVQKIEVTCYDTGSLTLTNSGTGTASLGTWTKPANEVWNHNGALISTPLTWEPATAVILADATEVEFDPKTVYVLPQSLVAGQQKVKVYYNVKVTTQTDVEKDNDDYAEEFDLYNSTFAYWQMNKNITYTLSFNPIGEMILFAPAVEEWGTASGSIVVM